MKSRPITAVHVDIARFALEVSEVSADSTESADKKLADWVRRLVRCLAMRDPTLHAYGAHLLAEVEEYRIAEIERKKGKVSADSTESADSQPRSDQSKARKNNTPPISPSGGLQAIFETARKAYPGSKRGFGPEWENFAKKFGKRGAEIVPLLLPAVQKYRSQLEKKSRQDGKPPFWANFATWINQERWTVEYPGEAIANDEDGFRKAQEFHRENGFYERGTPSAWMVA